MTTKTRLTELLGEATTRVDAFYQRVIELHTDERLRFLASQANEKGRIYLVGRRQDSEDEHLFYDHHGFNAQVAVECLEQGSYNASALYQHAEKVFSVRKGKLVVDAGQYGRREMLSVFPKLTVETIERRLTTDIGNSRWLKGEAK